MPSAVRRIDRSLRAGLLSLPFASAHRFDRHCSLKREAVPHGITPGPTALPPGTGNLNVSDGGRDQGRDDQRCRQSLSRPENVLTTLGREMKQGG